MDENRGLPSQEQETEPKRPRDRLWIITVTIIMLVGMTFIIFVFDSKEARGEEIQHHPGQFVMEKSLMCDTREQLESILHAFQWHGVDAGTTLYYELRRQKNRDKKPLCSFQTTVFPLMLMAEHVSVFRRLRIDDSGELFTYWVVRASSPQINREFFITVPFPVIAKIRSNCYLLFRARLSFEVPSSDVCQRSNGRSTLVNSPSDIFKG